MTCYNGLMMKRRLLIAGVAALILLSSSPFAEAQEAPASGETAPASRQRINIEEKARMLRGIRNEKKRAIIQRVDEKLMEMNRNLAERYSRMIVKIEEQLSRISARVEESANQGKNVQSARAAIQRARDAINTAKNEVSVQAGKVYDVEFSDEATARTGLGEVRRKLRDDMAALREKLRQAHRATVDSLTELKQLNQ